MTTDSTIDVRHLGRVDYVSSHVLVTSAGPVLLDTGPGSTLATLRAGLAALGFAVTDLHAVLLSHIHLDHAGAVGSLARENPRLTVYVHQLGAPHLIDPSKLIASATRIYGDKMDTYWGEFLPVPTPQLQVLRGGETLELGGRRFDVAYTPGHAVHHVSYYEPADRTAYVADTGGIRLPVIGYALPVTPPPDFNLEDWFASLDRVEAWKPRRLFCTHYGFSDDPVAHLAQLRAGLQDWTEAARRSLETDATDPERAAAFERHVLTSLADKATPAQIETCGQFSDFRASWYGIARYWRKRG